MSVEKSVKLLPSSDVKAFACIIVHDGLVAGINASNPFFVSKFNSQLFSMEIYFLLQQQLYCAKSFIVSETYPEMKGKL